MPALPLPGDISSIPTILDIRSPWERIVSVYIKIKTAGIIRAVVPEVKRQYGVLLQDETCFGCRSGFTHRLNDRRGLAGVIAQIFNNSAENLKTGSQTA